MSWADRVSDTNRGALWRFAEEFYRRPGIGAACLDLQDRHERDINLLLYVCWIGVSGRGRLTEADLARAELLVAPWRQAVVAPVRALRRLVKEEPDAVSVYAALKAAELEAEHRALDRLEEMAPPLAATPPRDPAADARANLSLYLGAAAAFDAAAPIRTALDQLD